ISSCCVSALSRLCLCCLIIHPHSVVRCLSMNTYVHARMYLCTFSSLRTLHAVSSPYKYMVSKVIPCFARSLRLIK
ncbi:hypothetical protein BJ912DRAFT_965731, partial [Pholiota molesta]